MSDPGCRRNEVYFVQCAKTTQNKSSVDFHIMALIPLDKYTTRATREAQLGETQIGIVTART